MSSSALTQRSPRQFSAALSPSELPSPPSSPTTRQRNLRSILRPQFASQSHGAASRNAPSAVEPRPGHAVVHERGSGSKDAAVCPSELQRNIAEEPPTVLSNQSMEIMRKRKRAHTEVRADEYNSSIAATPGRTKKRDLSPDSDIDSSTDFSEPESRVSSDRGSDQAGEDEQDVTPQHEDNDSASDDQAPATAKKKRRNVYEGMYDKAMAEVRFLKRLLEKGVGLSQKDVDACRQRVDNGTTYKRAIAHVFPPTHQNTQRRKNSAA